MLDENATYQEGVAGALFDFLGWATCQPGTLRLGETHDASAAVEALKKWADLRGLSLNNADVKGWQEGLP